MRRSLSHLIKTVTAHFITPAAASQPFELKAEREVSSAKRYPESRALPHPSYVQGERDASPQRPRDNRKLSQGAPALCCFLAGEKVEGDHAKARKSREDTPEAAHRQSASARTSGRLSRELKGALAFAELFTKSEAAFATFGRSKVEEESEKASTSPISHIAAAIATTLAKRITTTLAKRITTTLTAVLMLLPPHAHALTLQEAVDTALSNSPTLAQSQKSLDSAAHQLRIAKAQSGFTLSLSGGADSTKTEGFDLSETASARLSASVPLYTGGRLQASIDAADIYVEISRLELQQAADNLIYNVATAYIDALEARANHEVDLETRDNLASHEQNISALYNAGAKAKIDLLRAQVETSDAAQEAVRSQAAYEVNLTTLAALLSLKAISTLSIEEIAPQAGDFQLPNLENCISTAEENRYDLAADSLRIERGEYLLKSAKSAWLPSVSASASTGLNAQSDKWSPTSNAAAALTASWDIFDSRLTRAQVDDAQTEVERLQLALKADTDSALSDVVSAHKNLSSALYRLQTTQAAVDLALEERFIAAERYRAGEGILLDILDAEVALSTAKKNHVSAKYDVLRYRFALNHALGSTLNRS